jgi:DNA-3-methyladenine glycosylase I
VTARATLERCAWVGTDPLLITYHDEEWGVPSHDDRHLFEMLILEGAQAGLSWITVLRRRDAYRRAFHDFDAAKVARWREPQIERRLANPGLIRNRAKLESAVRNARAFLAIAAEMGSFDRYVWSFVGDQPRVNRWRSGKGPPAETPESKALSRDLRRRGFGFVGPTICYAFMQAVGLVDDHAARCYRSGMGVLGRSGGQPRANN